MTDFPFFKWVKTATVNITTTVNCFRTDLLNSEINVGLYIIRNISLKAKYCQAPWVMKAAARHFEFDKAQRREKLLVFPGSLQGAVR